MVGFLLDVHIFLAVVDAVQRIAPDVRVEHAARWRGGRLRTASDADLLVAAAEADLALVTFDVTTVRPLADAWIRAGRSFPGIVLCSADTVRPGDVGRIARGLVDLAADPLGLDPAYPVVYLQAP